MKIRKIIKDNLVFIPFVLILLILFLFYPEKIKYSPHLVDWKTIAVLSGLIVITTGIKESSLLSFSVKKMLNKIVTEKTLAVVVISVSAFLSMFLTNDIALFIMIPLTLSFQKFIKNDLKKIIVFQALAVNVGSTLTPVGNPQNIFLWHKWDISFVMFTMRMFPVFLVSFVVLIAFVFCAFPSKRLSVVNSDEKEQYDLGMFYFSLILLVGFIVSIEFGVFYYGLILVLTLYLIFFRKVLKKADWGLILLFIIIFVDFGILGQSPQIYKFVSRLNLNTDSNAFLGGLIMSQLVSNVPATIFISRFSSNWRAIAYGVNIGGNGIVIASLANIIAIRLAKRKGLWGEFHKYSIPFLLFSAAAVYLLFFVHI